MHIDDNSMEFDHWVDASEKYDYERFGEMIGDLIKLSFFELRDERAFDDLHKTRDCEFGIEEINGTYGWSVYEERKQQNLI